MPKTTRRAFWGMVLQFSVAVVQYKDIVYFQSLEFSSWLLALITLLLTAEHRWFLRKLKSKLKVAKSILKMLTNLRFSRPKIFTGLNAFCGLLCGLTRAV